MKKIIAAIWATILLSGCSGVNIHDYKDVKPALKIEEYFAGNTKAHGVFQDRFGKVRRSFSVDINGAWDDKTETLTLTEDFLYNDGQTEQRIWTINKTGENTYDGTAAGVIGVAKGISAGNAFNFKYKFNLPYNGDTMRVSFDDWMYLQESGVLFNKATISKFGIRLGDVYIFFDKP